MKGSFCEALAALAALQSLGPHIPDLLKLRSQEGALNPKYHNKPLCHEPGPSLWLLSTMQFSSQYIPPVSHPSFSKLSISTCDKLQCIGKAWISLLLSQDCGHFWGPLLHILPTRGSFYFERTKAWECEPLEATGSNVGWWKELYFFALKPKRMEWCAPKEGIPPLACVLHYSHLP